MNNFAHFVQEPPQRPPPYSELEVRGLGEADIPSVARLIAEGTRLEEAAVAVRLRGELLECGRTRALFTASYAGEMVGFGRVAYWDEVRLLSEAPAPPGYYLLGVLTTPAARRRGVARALTAARMAWLRGRTNEAFYFANARNMASIALHVTFGFEPATRRFQIPGVTFSGGEGVLFRAPLED